MIDEVGSFGFELGGIARDCRKRGLDPFLADLLRDPLDPLGK